MSSSALIASSNSSIESSESISRGLKNKYCEKDVVTVNKFYRLHITVEVILIVSSRERESVDCADASVAELRRVRRVVWPTHPNLVSDRNFEYGENVILDL